MLRASALTTNTEIDLQGINGDASAAGVGVEFGAELMQLGEAVARRDEAQLSTARQQLVELAGAAVLVDAAGVAANAFLWSLDAETGEPDPDFGSGGKVDLTLGLGREVDRSMVANSARLI